MIWLIVLLSVLGFCLLFTFGVALAAYLGAFYNGKRNPFDLSPIGGPQFEKYDTASIINKAAEIPFEEVHTQSHDGLNLYGRYYHAKDGALISLQFNGYKGNGIRDMAGGLQLSLELGYNVLLVD